MVVVLLSGSKTVKSVTQTRNKRPTAFKIKVLVAAGRHNFYLKANIFHFWFVSPFKFHVFHYSSESSWQVFADKLASAMQTTCNYGNLLATNAITRRLLVQHLLSNQFHLVTTRNIQYLPTFLREFRYFP